MKNLFILSILLVSIQSHGASEGCTIPPNEISNVATRILKVANDDSNSLDDSMNITADFEGDFSGEDAKLNGTWEGFYRPEENGFYSVLPIPLFAFELSRDRNVLYVCAHVDPDPAKQHFTLYFMRGYHLDKTKFGTILGDIFHRPQLEIAPLAPVLIPVGSISKKVPKGLATIIFFPLIQAFGIQSLAFEGIQRLVTSALGDISGISIERIVMTPTYIELSSGIDLNDPTKSKWKKRIPIDPDHSSTPN
jgi:hypothetical protein